MLNASQIDTMVQGAAAYEAAMNCECDDPEECGIYHDPEWRPVTHAITFVKANGDTDKRNNRLTWGNSWGEACAVDDVLDYLTNLRRWADDMVVLDLATGEQWAGPDFRP